MKGRKPVCTEWEIWVCGVDLEEVERLLLRKEGEGSPQEERRQPDSDDGAPEQPLDPSSCHQPDESTGAGQDERCRAQVEQWDVLCSPGLDEQADTGGPGRECGAREKAERERR